MSSVLNDTRRPRIALIPYPYHELTDPSCLLCVRHSGGSIRLQRGTAADKSVRRLYTVDPGSVALAQESECDQGT